MPNGKCAKCGQVQWVDTQSFVDSNHTKLRMTDGAHDEWVILPALPAPPVKFSHYHLPPMLCGCGCGRELEKGRDNATYRRDCKQRLERERDARRKR